MKNREKRRYQRPKIRIIELTMEEILGKCFKTEGPGHSPTLGCSGCEDATTS